MDELEALVADYLEKARRLGYAPMGAADEDVKRSERQRVAATGWVEDDGGYV